MFPWQTAPPSTRPPSSTSQQQVLLTEAMDKAKKAAELQARIQLQLTNTGLDLNAAPPQLSASQAASTVGWVTPSTIVVYSGCQFGYSRNHWHHRRDHIGCYGLVMACLWPLEKWYNLCSYNSKACIHVQSSFFITRWSGSMISDCIVNERSESKVNLFDPNCTCIQ